MTTETNDSEKLKDCTQKLISIVKRIRHAQRYLNSKKSSSPKSISNEGKNTEISIDSIEDTVKNTEISNDVTEDSNSNINIDITKGY